MDIMLVVVRPFAARRRGDAITEPDEIMRVVAEQAATDFVRVLIMKEA